MADISSSRTRPLPPNLDEAPPRTRQTGRILEIWEDVQVLQIERGEWKDVIENLLQQLHQVCSSIIKNGNNADKAYHAQQLQESLIQAQRKLALVHEQLHKSVQQLRRARAIQRAGMIDPGSSIGRNTSR